MFSNIIVIGLTLFGAAYVNGFYEVTVTDDEREPARVGVETYIDCIAHLNLFMHKGRTTYLLTSHLEDGVGQSVGNGYSYMGVVGRVITKKEGCECADGTDLVPAYLLTKPGLYDYMFSADPAEIASLKQIGYVEQRTDFYCSKEPNKCGATLPLFRHKSHPSIAYATVYTTSALFDTIWDRDGWVKYGIVCYIWPRQYIENDYRGQGRT